MSRSIAFFVVLALSNRCHARIERYFKGHNFFYNKAEQLVAKVPLWEKVESDSPEDSFVYTQTTQYKGKIDRTIYTIHKDSKTNHWLISTTENNIDTLKDGPVSVVTTKTTPIQINFKFQRDDQPFSIESSRNETSSKYDQTIIIRDSKGKLLSKHVSKAKAVSAAEYQKDLP